MSTEQKKCCSNPEKVCLSDNFCVSKTEAPGIMDLMITGETLSRVLQKSKKLDAILTECGRHDMATIEEALKKTLCPHAGIKKNAATARMLEDYLIDPALLAAGLQKIN